MTPSATILNGDCREVLKTLPDQSVQCVVTSPPYWGLRDYGHSNQIGLEKTPQEYVESLRLVFKEVWRVLKDDGTLWLNLGDSYASSPVGSFNGGGFKDKSAKTGGRDLSGVKTSGKIDKIKASGLKPKDLVGIPWRVAFALQADGWYLRSDIIWHKPNPMPESVTDRPTKSHEYIFLMSKKERYYYDAEAIMEPLATEPHIPGNKIHADKISGPNNRNGHSQWETSMDKVWGASGKRNKRSVWTVTTKPYKGAHFATFPPDLIKPCILAGTRPRDTVLDPFGGSGTTGKVAIELNRNSILIELNPDYIKLAEKRCDTMPVLIQESIFTPSTRLNGAPYIPAVLHKPAPIGD